MLFSAAERKFQLIASTGISECPFCAIWSWTSSILGVDDAIGQRYSRSPAPSSGLVLHNSMSGIGPPGAPRLQDSRGAGGHIRGIEYSQPTRAKFPSLDLQDAVENIVKYWAVPGFKRKLLVQPCMNARRATR